MKKTLKSLSPEAEAALAGLTYLPSQNPGYTRKRVGKSFRYFDAKGKPVTDKPLKERFRALVIPPAWKDVWISPHPQSHIQATGRDERGRKQYRYHALWRTQRDLSKFDKMMAFAKALPKIRRHIEKGLAAESLSREQILCTVIHLLESTLIRVGNEAYAKQNKSYGLTSLREKHVVVKSGSIRFSFKGKSGVMHDVELQDRRLARIIGRCHSLPGQLLFQYRDEAGEVHPVDSSDVNAMLRDISGADFTAKDFRTWCGSVQALKVLKNLDPPQTITEGKKLVKAAISEVAKTLRNTAAVCKKCYVHPEIIKAYLAGELHTRLRQGQKKILSSYRKLGLDADEAFVLALLDRLQTSKGKRKQAA